MFRLSYRTSYYFSHPNKFISEIYRDIYAGIRSIIRWIPVLWFDRNYDWTYLVRIMERKFELMESQHRNHGYYVGAEISAKQLKICQELCQRIRNDYNYFPNDQWSPEIGPWHQRYRDQKFKKPERQCYEDYMRQQDIDLLTKMIAKHLQKWWT